MRTSPTEPLRRTDWLILAGLVLLTLLAYGRVGECGFSTHDDPGYVSREVMVNQGLRGAAILWAFTAVHGGNWHPLTSLSHQLDCSAFGVTPGPMHWENVGWHAANACLVFLVWRSLTGAAWRAALVAALFALHPSHVESVAWISERKDLLCAFFWLGGMGAYLRWRRRRTRPGYALVLLCHALALLAKPMAVTFPLVLLLLDFWPENRLAGASFRRLVVEKIPFAALSGLFCVTTFIAQRSVGATSFGERLSLDQRLQNAVVSVVRYLGKLGWPTSLAAYYPHPGSWAPWIVAGAGAGVLFLTWLAWRQARSRPWFAFGWAWHLVTLLPVLGILQVGNQAMADRYAYLPSLGVFTVFAWALGNLVGRWPGVRTPVAAVALGAVGACTTLTREQVIVWKDGVSLYEQNVRVTPDNALAHAYLADAMEEEGRPEADVAEQCRRALALDPRCTDAALRLARQAARHRRYDDCRAMLEEARRLDPGSASVDHALGVLSVWERRPTEAIERFTEALRKNPSGGSTRGQLAKVFFDLGRLDDARAELETALRLDRWDHFALEKLGIVLHAQGRVAESRERFLRALWINPQSEEARKFLDAPPP